MARKTKRVGLMLTGEQRAMLTEPSRSRTAPIREVERAKILLGYAGGALISDVSHPLKSRNITTCARWLVV